MLLRFIVANKTNYYSDQGIYFGFDSTHHFYCNIILLFQDIDEILMFYNIFHKSWNIYVSFVNTYDFYKLKS